MACFRKRGDATGLWPQEIAGFHVSAQITRKASSARGMSRAVGFLYETCHVIAAEQ